MAIRAGHGALGELVRMRPLKSRPDGRMTPCALLIDSLRLRGNQSSTIRLMHRMATGAGHAAPGMITLDAPHMGGLIAMAREACFVSSRYRQLRRVDDFIRRYSLDVGACRAMTPLASMIVPASLLVEIDSLVRVFLKGVEDVFVAGLTDLRAYVGFRPRRCSGGSRLCFGLLA
jgi:hypothetical protein